jgi:O-antigen/teichoic acid export membrane protein
VQPERLARSGLLGLTGSVTAALAAFAVAVVVGNALGAYGTGLFFQAVGIFTIASQVLRLGTDSSIVRSISEQHAFDRHGEAWRTVVIAVVPVAVLSTAVATAMWWFAEPLATWLASPGTSEQLEPYLRFMAPFVPVGAILAVLQIASRMMNGIQTHTLAHSAGFPVIRLAAVVVAVWLVGSAFAAFAAWLSMIPLWLLLAAGLLARPIARDWRARTHASEPFGRASRRFWAFGWARAVSRSLEVLLEWSDVLIVAAIASPAAAGVYAVVTRTVRAGQVVDRAMQLAVSPAISRLLARGQVGATRALHTSVTRAMILCSWPFYLTLAIMAPAVLRLFGPEFESGSLALQIVAVAMMISSGTGMLQSVLLQGGRSRWQMYNKSVVLTASIGLNLLLVPLLGIAGAALTWALVVLLDTSIAAWQVHRHMGVALQPIRLLPAAAIPLVVFGAGLGAVRLLFGASVAALLIGVLGAGLVYVVVLWRLRRRLGIEVIWRELPGLGRFVDREPRATRRRPLPVDQ